MYSSCVKAAAFCRLSVCGNGLIAFTAPFFQETDKCIQKHRHDAEEHNAKQQPIHFKYLAGIDDQIT